MLSVVLVLTVAALFATWRLTRRLFLHIEKRIDDRANPNLCRCGYSLRELDVARCPECGRVIGFDATADELGLTTEHLRRAKTKRAERAGLARGEQ